MYKLANPAGGLTDLRRELVRLLLLPLVHLAKWWTWDSFCLFVVFLYVLHVICFTCVVVFYDGCGTLLRLWEPNHAALRAAAFRTALGDELRAVLNKALGSMEWFKGVHHGTRVCTRGKNLPPSSRICPPLSGSFHPEGRSRGAKVWSPHLAPGACYNSVQWMRIVDVIL